MRFFGAFETTRDRSSSFMARGTRARIVTAVVAALFAACVADASGADVVRYLHKNADGSFEERSAEGTVTQIDPNGVGIECDSEKDAPDENPIPTERVLWLLLQDAPLNLATARVETEVGEYEAALGKLADVEESELNREKYPFVAAEFDWYNAYASLQLALADAGTFKDGGSAMTRFVKEHDDSYRLYEGYRLLGDAFYAMSERQAKKETRDEFLKRALDAYGKLDDAESETIQTIGKLGQGKVALATEQFDDAKTLFDEVVEADPNSQEASEAKLGLARAAARQGATDDAIAQLRALLETTPKDATQRHARIYNALGDVYADADRPQEAVVAYLHVDLLYPAARSERVLALKALVGQWRKLGREDRAQETVDRLRDRFHVEVN